MDPVRRCSDCLHLLMRKLDGIIYWYHSCCLIKLLKDDRMNGSVKNRRKKKEKKCRLDGEPF